MEQEIARVKAYPLIDDLPNAIILERLKAIFRKHIGNENGAYMPAIYKSIHGTDRCSDLMYIYRCQRILQLINKLKTSTYYFIVSERDEQGIFFWYVLKTKDEANAYKRSVDYKVISLERMKEKADIHIKRENWKRLK